MKALLESTDNLGKRFTITMPSGPVERELAARAISLKSRSARPAQESDLDTLRHQIVLGVKHSSFLEALNQYKLSSIGTPGFSDAVEDNGTLVFYGRFRRHASD